MQTITDPAPYADAAASRIYELLFCDKPALFAARNEARAEYPWNVLLSDEVDATALQQISTNESLESRVRLLACNKLKSAGHASPKKELLGVVIEVALDNGLDVVAAYKDGTARYLNASGKMIFWDSPAIKTNALIETLFEHSAAVVQRIGPWEGERRPHPATGLVRLNFLVSDGLYFGEGPQGALFNDAMAKPVLMAALGLMQYLTETALKAKA